MFTSNLVGTLIFLWLAFFLGVAFTYFIFKRKYKRKSVGQLRIDTSDPDGPYMFLELSESVDSIMKSDSIVLKVNTENYIPRQ